MNPSYKHLTLFERESIMIMHSQGKTQTEIARILGRSNSTISRELNRHNLSEYRANAAYQSYAEHRKRCKAVPKLQQAEYRSKVQEKLINDNWSPEQISHRLKFEKSDLSISYTTIYRGIRAGWLDKGEQKAKSFLRRKGKPCKRKNGEETRGKIVISNHIKDRPKSAENRSRLGHWEADTVLGKAGGACLVTLTDRKSHFELVYKIPDKKAVSVSAAICWLLRHQVRRSITPDRGKEFAKHALVTRILDTEFYFSEPHQPWMRGTNENTNGLLREYFPKHQDMNQWDNNYIQSVVDKLNLRPRKCLGWRTPYEVHFKKKLHLV